MFHVFVRYTMATASLDRTVKLWDVRKLTPKSPMATMESTKTVNSAFFSPTGEYLLSTTQCDRLNVYHKPTSLSGNVSKATKAVKHNNWTGRWLSTFMARWHPTEDIFVVGCMQQPRAIELFDASGNLITKVIGEPLGSVSSRCCFHKSLPVVLGGNSSGRLHVLRNR